MVEQFIKKGVRFFTQKQRTIFSAATVIMVMIALSRLLGLVRNRVLAHYFGADLLSVYFAAFRIPEVIFEVLIFGTLTSAFIPIFVSYWSKSEQDEAWKVAATSFNLAFSIFLVFAGAVFFLGKPIYALIAPGFSVQDLELVTNISKLLILVQAFFLVSYFLTAILESLQRFLVPAVAPLFYNLGIILGAVFLHSRWGIWAPAIGAVIGAFCHFLIQLPLVFHLGFRWRASFDWRHPGVRKIGRLALPRVIELSFLQLVKNVELLLASLIGNGAYTYLTFADSLRLLPVSLFGASIAKASLPILSYCAKDRENFGKIFYDSLAQILFFTLPFSVFLAVLRIPAVRLVFGAARFDWEATVQTSYALSAYSLGICAYSLVFLLNRSFYALKETRIPVVVSIGSFILDIGFAFWLVISFRVPVWGLALASSLATILQAVVLFFLLQKKIGFLAAKVVKTLGRILLASLIAGAVMYVILKVFDRSVWEKSLSFLGVFGLKLPSFFENLVLDTRYTLNLLLISFLVSGVGLTIYLFMAWILKIEQLAAVVKLVGLLKSINLGRLTGRKDKEKIITVSTPDEGEQL